MSGDISTDKQTMEMKYFPHMNKQHGRIETRYSAQDWERTKIIALPQRNKCKTCKKKLCSYEVDKFKTEQA